MADILCPNCKKNNPVELEVCQFCGTSLKTRGTEPLAPIHPGEMPIKKQTSELERTLPGWLRDIRKGDEASPSENAAPIGQPVPPVNLTEPPKAPPPKKKEDSPLDLLAGLSQANDEEEDVPDWLASLKTNLPGGPVPSAEPSSAAETEQPADWLAGLGGTSQPEAPAPESAPSDWGFGAPAASPIETDEPAPQVPEETPDWLAALKAQDQNQNARPTPQPAPSDASFPPAQDSAFSGDLPDWLNNLSGGSEPPPTASEPTPPAEPVAPAGDLPMEGGLPDWLSGLTQSPASPVPAAQPEPATFMPAPAESSPIASEESPADGLPGWLAGLSEQTPAADSAPATEPPAPVQPAASSETPDWFAGLGNTPVAATPASPVPAAETSPADDEDLPDWLASVVGSGKPAEPASSTPAAPAPPSVPPPAEPSAAKAFSTGSLEEINAFGKSDEVPDWMAGLGAGASAAMAQEPEQPGQAPAEDTPPAASSADAFDWSGLAEQAGPAASSAAASEPVSQPVASEPSAPEAALPAASDGAGGEQNLDSILSMEMPDWLAGFTPSETDTTARTNAMPDTTSPSTGENISPAELPSWVQAMRPMEAVIAPGTEGSDEDQTVEKEGPLAGLRSVLKPQTGSLNPHKPRPYSIKLQVDTTQQAQAALLEKLIASEAESHPITTPKRVVNIRPLRWVITAVLLLAVLVPIVIGTRFFPVQPADLNSSIGHFHSLIDGLSEANVVLVVFDYEPGYAGELEQASGPVLEQLMDKNVRMVFVSNSPTGVFMSERLTSLTNSVRAKRNSAAVAYQDGLQYISLGYLPGDAAGIQVFAADPSTLDVKSRLKDFLGNVQTDRTPALSDFSAVIVLANNPDTSRMWIEQTMQERQGKPMLIVLSAQAEPMVRPYYDSGQIQGMISGLSGGVSYEKIVQSDRTYWDTYWDPYSVGMIAAELLIVFGGGWALIEYLRTRRAETVQEEQEDDGEA